MEKYFDICTLVTSLEDENFNVNQFDENGMTILHHCCKTGHIYCAELLIEKGANIEITDNKEYTPLRYATECGYDLLVELLAERHNAIVPDDLKKIVDEHIWSVHYGPRYGMKIDGYDENEEDVQHRCIIIRI